MSHDNAGVLLVSPLRTDKSKVDNRLSFWLKSGSCCIASSLRGVWEPCRRLFAFNSDIKLLKRLITNTFYSNYEIFLRDLTSDSSDALDMIQHESITDPEKVQAQPNFFINIIPVNTNSTIKMEDSGVQERAREQLDPSPKLAPRLSWCMSFGGENHDDEQYLWEFAAGGSFSVLQDSEHSLVS